MSNEEGRNYFTYISTIHSNYDWFLRQALTATGERSWSTEEILQAMKAYTGVQPQEDKVLRYLTRRFAERQSAPLRRVGQDRYVIDTDYYRLFADEIYPPRPGRRGPRPKSSSSSDKPVSSLLKAPATEKRRKRCHQKYYRRLIKHPEKVWVEVFQHEQELDLQAITERIRHQFDGTPFKHTTIKELLDRYIDEPGGSLFLERTESGTYRVHKLPKPTV